MVSVVWGGIRDGGCRSARKLKQLGVADDQRAMGGWRGAKGAVFLKGRGARVKGRGKGWKSKNKAQRGRLAQWCEARKTTLLLLAKKTVVEKSRCGV